jgi:hypothetical protein
VYLRYINLRCLRSTGQILKNASCKISITYKSSFLLLEVHYEPDNHEHALKSKFILY